MSHPLFEPDIPGIDPVSMQAFRAFKRSMMLHRRLLMALFGTGDMHPAQAGCLQVLDHRDGISQSDLAEILHVSRPTVTTMLQRMEASGAIERRADEADSRVTRVYLTAEGRNAAAGMRDGFVQMLDLSVGRLAPDDRAELKRLLDEVNANVEAALQERGISTSGHPHGHGGSDN